MASAVIDSVIQKLESLKEIDLARHPKYKKSSETRSGRHFSGKMEIRAVAKPRMQDDNYYGMERKLLDLTILRLLRTFFLCGRVSRSHLNMESSVSISGIERSIQEEAQRLLHGLSLLKEKRCSTIFDFPREIHRFKGEIDGLYADILECLSKSICSLPAGVFMEFFESLPKNLVDIQNLYSFRHKVSLKKIEPLQEQLILLKKFVCFAVSRGLEQRQLENFLINCQVVGVKVAHLSCMSWFDKRETLNEDISELVDMIKPVHLQVRETYIQVLKAIKLSGSLVLSTEVDKEILSDFVDYLLGSLWEVLLLDGTSFMLSGKYQMRMLYEGLRFLRNILRKQQEKFNGLQAHTKDLVGAVITDAGILIFSVYMHHQEEGSEEQMIQVLCSLLEKIQCIMEEVPEAHPVKPTFNFPATKELEFIDHLLENLKELVRCKIDSLSSVKAVVLSVQEDLLFLRSSLQNVVEQRNQHEKYQAFLSNVVEVAYETEFVIDSLMVGDISCSLLMLFNTIAEQMKLVKTEALEIGGDKYALVEQKTSKTLSLGPFQKTVSTINEVVVGLSDQARTIIDQLTRGPKKLDVVCIVGMPGLGKTTLAQKVYHDDLILCHFTSLAWCCISQECNEKDLLIEILACIFPNNSKEYSGMKEDDLAQELYRRLKGKRYLIVLDDVWDIKAWNALEISFPDDANGSRILLTSRHSDVARQIKPTGKLHPLRRLTDSESLELLQKKLAAGKEHYHPALPVLGEKIARNCHGLPLTVVAIAGILSTLDAVGWEEVAEKLNPVVCGMDNCKNILELSYVYLPDSLKPCLLYFGVFKEDQEISIQRLMQLWIAEGFVEKNSEKGQQQVAEEYLMALISRSLIMVAKRSSIGGVKTCRIHDLLHEFCVAKAKEGNFMQFVRGFDELSIFDVPHNVRRICINSQPKDFAMSRLFCPRIRSLLFNAQSVQWCRGRYNLEFFFHLKLLRVLDLAQMDLGFGFPDEITMLILLRYLAVSGMMSRIPTTISNLSNLEAFVITNLSSGCYFPDVIWTMQKLRYLRVNVFPVGLSFTKENLESSICLHNLDSFSNLKLYLGDSLPKVLRKFPNIRKLKCSLLKPYNSIGDAKKIVEMGFLSRLHSLRLILDEVHLDQTELHFPSNLKKLTVRGELSSSILSTAGKLNSLEALKLKNLSRGGAKVWEMEEGDFPELKFLKLETMQIERWTGSDEHLPCLEKLILTECRWLKELPSCLECSSTLESIEVHSCPESVVSLVQALKEELMSAGNETLKVVIDRSSIVEVLK